MFGNGQAMVRMALKFATCSTPTHSFACPRKADRGWGKQVMGYQVTHGALRARAGASLVSLPNASSHPPEGVKRNAKLLAIGRRMENHQRACR